MEMLKEDLMDAINNDDWDKFSVLMDSSQVLGYFKSKNLHYWNNLDC